MRGASSLSSLPLCNSHNSWQVRWSHLEHSTPQLYVVKPQSKNACNEIKANVVNFLLPCVKYICKILNGLKWCQTQNEFFLNSAMFSSSISKSKRKETQLWKFILNFIGICRKFEWLLDFLFHGNYCNNWSSSFFTEYCYKKSYLKIFLCIFNLSYSLYLMSFWFILKISGNALCAVGLLVCVYVNRSYGHNQLQCLEVVYVLQN